MKLAENHAGALRTRCTLIDARIDPAFVDSRSEDPERFAEATHTTHQAIPEKPVEPARSQSGATAERNDGVRIQLVDPHLVFEEAKDRRLRPLEWIGGAGAAVNQNAET